MFSVVLEMFRAFAGSEMGNVLAEMYTAEAVNAKEMITSATMRAYWKLCGELVLFYTINGNKKSTHSAHFVRQPLDSPRSAAQLLYVGDILYEFLQSAITLPVDQVHDANVRMSEG